MCQTSLISLLNKVTNIVNMKEIDVIHLGCNQAFVTVLWHRLDEITIN